MTSRQSISVRVISSQPSKWDASRRLKVALANNNRGTWHVATSRRTVADIERKFAEGSVGRILIDVTGGILGDHAKLRTGSDRKEHYLYMQLLKYNGDVGLCLSELGVQIMDQISFDQIRLY